MDSEDKLYRDLQIHLDRQTIGFPETKSGSDIDLLRQIFRPEDAEMTMMLTYRYESLEQIHERANKIGKSLQETERLLDETAAKGIIGFRKKDGEKQFRTIPYIVGMAEAALQSPTPELISAHARFMEDGLFPRAFLNTRIPQIRTIPVRKSITPKHHVGRYDDIRELIKTTDGPITVFECVCRKGAEVSGNPCKRTSRKETCMALGEMFRNVAEKRHIGRQVSKEEALEILQQNEDDALVLQPVNAQAPDFICSCCGCCCGALQLHKAIPDPVSHWVTNYYAEVNSELCMACGSCEERCQTGAVKLDQENTIAAVDLRRCLGCGLCVVDCPENAIALRKKEIETIPPRTGEEMMEVIMINK